MSDLTGRTALITGGASGIGAACARSLAGRGASVTIADVDEVAAKELASELHGEAWAVDLLDTASLDDLTLDVDILVNNAGIQHVAALEDFPAERWDAIIAINLSSAFHTTRLALPGMKQKNWGRIINLASVHGLVGSSQKSAYVAAKHGLVGLTKVTALETAQTGVTCNAICPGFVLTPLVQKQVDDRAAREGLDNDAARKALLLEKQPSGEFVTPDELGALAVFFCSPAANQVRGVAWNMDGGWAAQ